MNNYQKEVKAKRKTLNSLQSTNKQIYIVIDNIKSKQFTDYLEDSNLLINLFNKVLNDVYELACYGIVDKI